MGRRAGGSPTGQSGGGFKYGEAGIKTGTDHHQVSVISRGDGNTVAPAGKPYGNMM